MERIQLFLQLEGAHDLVDELGKIGLVQFDDLNAELNAFHRNFANDVKVADEMERRVTFFQGQVEREEFSRDEMDDMEMRQVDENVTPQQVQELDSRLEELERDLLQMNTNQEQLQRNYNEFVEFKHVLQKEASFFDGAGGAMGPEDLGDSYEVEAGASVQGGMSAAGLGYITGVIPNGKMRSFERVLWRALRGNLFMKKEEVDVKLSDPSTGELVEKTVFIIFYQGARSKGKVQKLCESFGANLYPCPATAGERAKLSADVERRLGELVTVLDRSTSHRRRVLLNVASHIEAWTALVVKEKAIYHTMNMFNYDEGRRCMIAEGWCPVAAHDDVLQALERAQRRSGARVLLNVVQSDAKPPTYFRTNRVTEAFQNLITSYGAPRYKEVNPAVYTIVTFPFLFGVMFGDVGHGICLTLVGLYLVLAENSMKGKKLNEMLQMLYDGRYLLLTMGIHAIYCGALYNEAFSVSMDIFGSRWKYREGCGEWLSLNSTECVQMVRTDDHIAYPFGVDPAWKGAKNELQYYNSVKMKMSVIMGVLHMSLGICMTLFNGVYFRQPLDIIFEFIPGLTFLMCLFGYMNFLIFYKWCIDWTGREHEAPLIITVMIEMFLHPWGITPLDKPNPTDIYNNDWNVQLYVQAALFAIALICVPLMLIPKPVGLFILHKRKAASGYETLNHASSDSDLDDLESSKPASASGGDHGHGEGFDIGEVAVHQLIHTIEFVLGAVSNTASYLRLWALSLAHSELSAVFWNRVMLNEYILGPKGYFITIFIGFAVWAVITVAVLLVMESLSAFLHSLRLTWVEAAGKHFQATGYLFAPLSYEALFSNTDE